MKKIIFFALGFLLMLFMIFGCSKPPEAVDRITAAPGIEFKANGQLKQYVQVNAGATGSGASRTYTFIATKEPTAENYFQLFIQTDSLRVGLHTSNFVAFREGTTIRNNVGSFTIMVLSNNAGMIEATFSGNLSGSSVTEGKIQSVQIIFQ